MGGVAFATTPDRTALLVTRKEPPPAAPKGGKGRGVWWGEVWDVWDWKAARVRSTFTHGGEFQIGGNRRHTRVGGGFQSDRGVSFSTDGTRLTAPAELRVPELGLTNLTGPLTWDVATGKVTDYLRVWPKNVGGFPVPNEPVQAVAWSPDGTTIAAFGGGWPSERLWFWDVARGRASESQFKAGVELVALRYLQDGNALLAAGKHGVRLWDIKGGRQLQGFGDDVRRLVLAPDGKAVAVLTGGGTIQVWQLPRRTWPAPPPAKP